MGQVDLGAAGGEGRSCLLVISLGESRSPARSTVALLWIKRPCISFSYFVFVTQQMLFIQRYVMLLMSKWRLGYLAQGCLQTLGFETTTVR